MILTSIVLYQVSTNTPKYLISLLDVECGIPANITNGKVTLATNVTYYGAAVLYECNANFKLDGVSRRLCTEDGTWSHEKPACIQITCDEPDISENLIVDIIDHSVGSQAKFKCAKGRTLIGNNTRVCLKNGKWAGKSPSCKRKYHYNNNCLSKILGK